MQSVNVIISTNLNKGNDNRLLIECNTAVTVPNTIPQRNTDGPATADNNNSYKLGLVDVYDKNYGALYRFPMEPTSQCRSNQIPGRDIPECDYQILDLNKSDYLGTSDLTYNDANGHKSRDTYMTTARADGYVCFSRLIALSKRTNELMRKGLMPKLGLLGGGESSLSTGTTGWGTPPSTNSNNNNGNSHFCHFIKSMLSFFNY